MAKKIGLLQKLLKTFHSSFYSFLELMRLKTCRNTNTWKMMV